MISKPLANENQCCLLPYICINNKVLGKTAFIYRNISIYRIIMNLLYKGRYNERFEHITSLISGKKATEICFGDTIIAEYCSGNAISWTGIDINENFVKKAIKKGYKAEQADVQKLDTFPLGDVCILSGSLYHFHEDTEELFRKMLECAPQIILSEPVINISNTKGIIGKLAKASANVKGQKQAFRYTLHSLTDELNHLSKKLNFNYKVIEQFDKDLIIVITK